MAFTLSSFPTLQYSNPGVQFKCGSRTRIARYGRVATYYVLKGSSSTAASVPCLRVYSVKPGDVARVRAIKEKTEEINSSASSSSSAEEVTKKFGLEAGLWKIFSSKDEGKEGDKGKNKSKGDQAKELLAKYGGAYLATSITLSLISFSLCYALISFGVDVPALLQKVGIASNETGDKVGTFALAYAAHKAASPIRFPPTVALTPIVANWIGKKVDKEV